MTTRRMDDLADVLVGGGSRLGGTAGRLEWTGRAQGVLLAWDTDTFENTVQVRGSELTNLNVSASSVEAITWRPGDVVILDRWKPSGSGTAVYWIAGRVLTPGQGRAEESIAFMRTALAEQISVDILADRVKSADGGGGSVDSSSFSDGDGGPGPIVPDVEIRSGSALVLVGMVAANLIREDSGTVRMSVEVSGATSIGAGWANGLPEAVLGNQLLSGAHVAGHPPTSTPFSARRVSLNNGTHTFTGKYRISGSSIDQGGALDPTVIVIAF